MATKLENPNDEPDEIGKAHPVEHAADIERDDERGRGQPRSDADIDAADDGSTESSQEHAGFGRGEQPRKAKSRSR